MTHDPRFWYEILVSELGRRTWVVCHGPYGRWQVATYIGLGGYGGWAPAGGCQCQGTASQVKTRERQCHVERETWISAVFFAIVKAIVHFVLFSCQFMFTGSIAHE